SRSLPMGGGQGEISTSATPVEPVVGCRCGPGVRLAGASTKNDKRPMPERASAAFSVPSFSTRAGNPIMQWEITPKSRQDFRHDRRRKHQEANPMGRGGRLFVIFLIGCFIVLASAAVADASIELRIDGRVVPTRPALTLLGSGLGLARPILEQEFGFVVD